MRILGNVNVEDGWILRMRDLSRWYAGVAGSNPIDGIDVRSVGLLYVV